MYGKFKIVCTLLKYIFLKNFYLVCFKVFDNDQDGYLSKDEISQMVDVMLFICNDNIDTQNKSATDESGINLFLFINIILSK